MDFFTYIVASRRNGTIYTGSTEDVVVRAEQHKQKTFKGFTAKHGVCRLVWFERHPTRDAAFRRERQIKKWNRPWKLRMIEEKNPEWNDLAAELRLGGLKDAADWEPPLVDEAEVASDGLGGKSPAALDPRLRGDERRGTMSEISEGMAAPALDLPTDGGGRFDLADGADRTTILFFYPKADTPSCTNEAKDFSALADAFAKAGARVVGVSRDPVRALDRFRTKHGLKVILGSDEDGAVTEAWGVWVEKSMYGRTYMGIDRATFLIDAAGTVRRVWRKVRVKGHADEVLAAAQDI